MKKTWKTACGKYANGEELWLGKVPAASWFNPIGRKGEPKKYRAEIRLPGISLKAGREEADSSEEIRARIERVVDTWFSWLEVEG